MLRRPPCQKPCAIGGICTRCNATRFLCTIHHFVWPPFARITASQRSCIWSIYFLKSSTCSLSHSSSIYCRTSSSVLGNRLPTWYFNSRQMFLIIFKLGELVGYFILYKLLRLCKALIALAIWEGTPSSIRMMFFLPVYCSTSSLYIYIIGTTCFLYASPDILLYSFSNTTNLPLLYRDIIPYIIQEL